MAGDPDFLESLWIKCINVDPGGEWMDQAVRAGEKSDIPFVRECAKVLSKMRRLATPEQIGCVSRFVRYEACFAALSALEDPGLPRTPPTELFAQFNDLLLGAKPKPPFRKYIEALVIETPLKPDGQWLVALANKPETDEPFGNTGKAIQGLLSAGASAEELGWLASGSYFEAMVQTHQLLQEFKLIESEEFEGLHELLLGSDPSGMEGRPGSWPIQKEPAHSTKPPAPLWKTRAGQAIAFSPDGSRVAIAGASGPARIFDARTGAQLAVCEGLKVHISHLAFSPDGKRLAVAQMYVRSTVCDALNGKLLAKNIFPKPADEWAGISGLAYSANGEILRSARKQTIDVTDAATFRNLEPLRPAARTRSLDGIAFSPDGQKLVAIWDEHLEGEARATIWKWPGREILLRFGFACGILSDVAFSPTGTMIAVRYGSLEYKNVKGGVSLFDAATGQMVRNWIGPRGPGIAFGQNNLLLAADDNCIWMVDTQKDDLPKSIAVCSKTASIYQIAVSPNGDLLGTAGSNGASIWDIMSLWKA